MKTLHELYCILWEEVKDKKQIHRLCWEIDYLFDLNLIDSEEFRFLMDHFKSQKPSQKQHAGFTKHPNWYGGNYWWKLGGTEERKRFVQLMMELTK